MSDIMQCVIHSDKESGGELLLLAASGRSCPDTAMFHFRRITGWCRRAAPQDGMKCLLRFGARTIVAVGRIGAVVV